ncbi:ParA family protein [bacterium]|jgi:cellulose biosynthesis protein BcsQ|nr:ParA family protein [bacterium]
MNAILEFGFSFLNVIQREDPRVLGEIFVAFVFGAGLFFGLSRLRKTTDVQGVLAAQQHVDTLQSQNSNLENQIKHRQEIEEKLTAELDHQKEGGQRLLEKYNKLLAGARKLWKEREALHKERGELLKQISDVVESDGRVWEKVVPPDAFPFVPIAQRRCRIVSIVNLKGGVGKTTLTANIGYTLAQQGGRVLFVDLDHQASLTSLCLPPGTVQESRDSGRFIQKAFAKLGHDVILHELVQPIPDSTMSIAATDEDLTHNEMKVLAAWQMKSLSVDGRLILRQTLHARAIADAFDWILIDCPPRLTTSSINALACSDYFLVPAVVDSVSLDAVPRMLKWVSRLKSDKVKLCPHLSLLGIVASMTQNAKSFTNKEKQIWDRLRRRVSDGAWHDAPNLFRAFVPKKVVFADVASKEAYPRMAARDPDVAKIFEKLVAEITAKVPIHGRVSSETIHS